MFSIREAADRSGISSYTLRYYEKIGLLPPPKRRPGGSRFYTDSDIRFMHFLKSLKETGMPLEDMTEFVRDGCIFEMEPRQTAPSINRRIEILSKHLETMEAKKRELDEVISTTKQKLGIYHSILKEEADRQ